jgi:hypothetical protein
VNHDLLFQRKAMRHSILVTIALVLGLPLGLASAQQPVFNPATGHYYQVVPGTVTWDQAKAAAETMSFNGVAGHLVTYDDLAEDQFVYFTLAGGSLGNAWIGLYQDMNDPNYSEPGGGWKWVTGEAMTYSNWKQGEPSNSGNAEHYGGYWPADKWNDYVVGDGAVGRYVVEFDTLGASSFCFGNGSAGACPCGNFSANEEGCTNSSGAGALLTSTGTSSLGAADLSFSSSSLMPGRTAILFEGTTVLSGGNGVAFGDGLRCAGGSLRRRGYRTPDGAGAANWMPGTMGTISWMPGDTRQFQVWYSDSAGSLCGTGFNTSNAIEINFVP